MQNYHNDHHKREDVVIKLAKLYNIEGQKEISEFRQRMSFTPYRFLILPLVEKDLKWEYPVTQIARKYCVTKHQLYYGIDPSKKKCQRLCSEKTSQQTANCSVSQ